MKGRIPNAIKNQAEREVAEYGSLAHHYACYNTDWSNPKSYDLRLISAIKKQIGATT